MDRSLSSAVMGRFLGRVTGFLLLAALLATLGCSKNVPGTQTPSVEPTDPDFVASLNGQAFFVRKNNGLSSDGTSVEGSGTIEFKERYVESDNNFMTVMALAPGGSLEIRGNSRTNLVGGAGMIFKRNAETNNLEFFVVKGDGTLKDVTADFEDWNDSVDASQPLKIELDIHRHGHVVLWVNDGEEFGEGTLEVSGTVWGLVLNGATVSQAERREAKDQH